MQKKSKLNFHKAMVLLAWVLIISGVVGIIWYAFFTSKYQTTNDAQVDQYITPVSSRVSGFIKEVRFEENQAVKKGDTLLVIDNEEYQNKAIAAQADLETSTSTILVNQAEAHVKQSEIGVIEAQLKNAKVQVWKTEQDYKRFENLVQEKAATQQQFERIKAEYESALATQKAISEQLIVAKANQSEAVTKIVPVTNASKSKKAHLNNAELYVRYTIVVAPYDGFVGNKYIQPGQFIKEGQTLVNVVSAEKWVTANFRETQMSEINVGTEVYFTVDAIPGKKFYGTIHSFSPASGSKFSLLPQNNATGNFIKIEQRIPTKIILKDNQEIEKLLAGMNVMIHATKN